MMEGVKGLCERLRGTRPVREVTLNCRGEPCLVDTEQRTPINPDGPEAADALEQLQAEVERLRAVVAKIMPISVHNGPDYAEAYFGDGNGHSTQAMTMNPKDWQDIADAFAQPKEPPRLCRKQDCGDEAVSYSDYCRDHRILGPVLQPKEQQP